VREVPDQCENNRVRGRDHQLGATRGEAENNAGRENEEEGGSEKSHEPVHLY